MNCVYAGIREEALIALSYFFKIKTIYTVKNSRVHKFAKRNKIKFFLISKKNKKEIFLKIEKSKSDILFSAGFPYIFPYRVLKNYKFRLNSHPSLLPKNKGVSPIKEVYFSNQTKIGVSLHIMKDKVDSGKVIYQDFFLKKNLTLNKIYDLTFAFLEPIVIIKGLQKYFKIK